MKIIPQAGMPSNGWLRHDHIIGTVLMCLSLLVLPVSLLAETITGFVTRIDSPTEIEIGTMHALITPQTSCIFEALPEDNRTNSSTPTSPCNLSRMTIGSRVKLTGKFAKNSEFIAARLELEIGYVEPCKRCWLMTLHTHAPGDTPGVLVHGALSEESPAITKNAQGWNGTWWIDGYPMEIDTSTRLISSPDSTVLHKLGADVLNGNPLEPKYHIHTVHELRSSRLLSTNTWLFYRAKYKAGYDPIAGQIILWPNQTSISEKEFLSTYAATVKPPSYPDFTPGSLQYLHGTTIEIVEDQSIATFIDNLGESLVPEYQKRLTSSDATKVSFSFYVVHPFIYSRNSHFVSVDGKLPRGSYEDLAGDRYNAPKIHAYVTSVIAMPDGKVLIPDVVLARMSNRSQVAALLSYAIASILQKQAWNALPITRPHHIGSTSDYYLIYTLIAGDEQLLRLGIRQMYLTGYDIREAPYAWAVAQGRSVNNPVINSKDPDKEIPWYAAYAFDYISKYYSDVDYSKLKRGEAEYQQFLQELRKADPDAFAADAKPQK